MHLWKQILALSLVIAMCFGMLPGKAQAAEPGSLTDADYAAADTVFDALDLWEDSDHLTMTRDAWTLCALVCELPGVVPDSVRMEGGQLTWMTEAGIACGWSGRAREILAAAEPGEMTHPREVTMEFTSKGVHGKDVYVFQPYYGLDKNFKDQYYKEGQQLAKLTGGTFQYKAAEAVTVDVLAQALQNGGVIVMDSHGDTDYENPDNSKDYVSGAHTSYICLQTKDGLTQEDFAFDEKANCYHAKYLGHGSRNNPDMYMNAVDGTVIANHMTGKAKGGLFWETTCLGMSTDGIVGPLMEKGLGVIYGYSQTITFVGDSLFGSAFFKALKEGNNVASSIDDMRRRYGKWDYSSEICAAGGMPASWAPLSEGAARRCFCAFPIVVSAQDPYPGKGKVDAVQQVHCTWKLVDSCAHDYQLVNAVKPTCTKAGYSGDTVCADCGDVKSGGTAVPALGHSFGEWTLTLEPKDTEPGQREHSCQRCGFLEKDSVPHTDCPSCQFRDVYCARWYHAAVDFAVERGIMTGMSPISFAPNGTVTRAQLAKILYNLAGSPVCQGGNPFADVAEGKWYYDAVTWAANAGIVCGMTETVFAPNEPLSRQDMVVMLYRTYGQGEEISEDLISAFGDSEAVRAYAAPALNWALAHEYLHGAGGLLLPRTQMTRAEAATVMMNFLLANTQ